MPDGKIAHRSRRGRVLLGDGVERTAARRPSTTARRGRSAAASTSARRLGDDLAQPAQYRQRRSAAASISMHLRAGGRLLIDDSLTYAQTPTFKVDGVTTPDRPGIDSGGCGAQPAPAADRRNGRHVARDRRARPAGPRRPGIQPAARCALPPRADDEPRELVLRDCTLVPGLALNPDGSAVSPGAREPHRRASVRQGHARAMHHRSAARGRRRRRGRRSPTASSTRAHRKTSPTRPMRRAAPAPSSARDISRRATARVIGKVHTKLLRLASNSIFFARLGPAPAETWIAPLIAERRQEGCVRFCFVPPGSITPAPLPLRAR